MDSFFKQLDKGLDSIAGKIEKMEKKWNEGGVAGEEGVGDVYSINGSRYRVVKKLAEGLLSFPFAAVYQLFEPCSTCQCTARDFNFNAPIFGAST
jgi:hypothetical protein